MSLSGVDVSRDSTAHIRKGADGCPWESAMKPIIRTCVLEVRERGWNAPSPTRQRIREHRDEATIPYEFLVRVRATACGVAIVCGTLSRWPRTENSAMYSSAGSETRF